MSKHAHSTLKNDVIARAYLVPPTMLGDAPAPETARQRAEYITAMAEPMGVNPYLIAEDDPGAQWWMVRIRLREMGAL